MLDVNLVGAFACAREAARLDADDARAGADALERMERPGGVGQRAGPGARGLAALPGPAGGPVEPTEEQRFFLDVLLVSIAEHGMMPTNVAARMTLAADPDSLQGAVAAGILGCGPVVLGTAEECARLLEGVRDAHLVPADLLREPGRG